jgi:hypothetical protein
VAIELTAGAVAANPVGETAWMLVCEEWGGELDRRLGAMIEMWRFHAGSPNVQAAFREHGLLVYERG